MQEGQQSTGSDYVELSADIVSAYVSKNAIPVSELPALIGTVHQALRRVADGNAKEPEKLVPIVPINKTVRPEYIISLEDGKKYRSLKRHLRGRGLTPEQYRTKWGLSPSYPMTAPEYSKRRSELAKALGLGQARKGKTAGKKASKKGTKRAA
jgi:predicted transcriptional regulator